MVEIFKGDEVAIDKKQFDSLMKKLDDMACVLEDIREAVSEKTYKKE